MAESSKWIATIPTPSLANIGKIDIATELLAPYSDLMVHFLSDINLRFVRDNEYLSFTKAKPYQTKDDYNKLLESCKKRYARQLEKGLTLKESLDNQLKVIKTYAVQTPLSARYVQTCYKQTLETYSSWLTSLEDMVRSILVGSSIVDDHFLATCYRIYLPLKRNPYLDDCLKKGERLPFVQVRLTDKLCTISAIVGYDKAPLRTSTESIGLDFGMVAMFTTSDGERHGLSSFTKLKIWDEELLQLTKELQQQFIKLSTNERYNQLQQRIKSYFKNEIGRILNKLAKKNVGVFVVEKLDFRAAGLSKRMNRLIGRTYRSFVKAKLSRLEEQYGTQIIAVNPAYTSQECSRCHYVSKDNRKSQKDFVCQHCHFSCNADVNAGRVINQRRSLMLEFPVYLKNSTSRTVRCQVQEASEECHRRYCYDNGIMTYEETLAKGSL